MDGSSTSAAALLPGDWEALIRLHEQPVFLSLLAQGVRPSRARELTHDAFTRLFERWSDGRLDLLSLPGLAIAQARFLALADGRLGRSAHSDVMELTEHADGRPSPEQQLAARQLVAGLERALEACPKRARELYTLAFTHPEVRHEVLAARAGISVQRLRQTLCEVRARLRDAVKESL